MLIKNVFENEKKLSLFKLLIKDQAILKAGAGREQQVVIESRRGAGIIRLPGNEKATQQMFYDYHLTNFNIN